MLGWYRPAQRVMYWNKFGMPEWGTHRYARDQGDRYLTHVWWVDPDKEAKLAAAEKDESLTMDRVDTDVMFWKDYAKQMAKRPAPAAAPEGAAPAGEAPEGAAPEGAAPEGKESRAIPDRAEPRGAGRAEGPVRAG